MKLLQWLAFRDATLDKILWHDGLADYLEHQNCIACGKEAGIFKCQDCFGGSHLRCQSCMVRLHEAAPLHRIEVSLCTRSTALRLRDFWWWTGTFFNKDSLSNLGLCIELRHVGSACPCPSPEPPNFMVFDTSGVHLVNIDYCECPREDVLDRRTQLLRWCAQQSLQL